jgi:hypothetical protein
MRGSGDCMARDQAAEISTSGVTVDGGDATVRCLLYGLLPSWFVPGVADWWTHRRTRIEETAGTKGAPTLMMAEVRHPHRADPALRGQPAAAESAAGRDGCARGDRAVGCAYGRRERPRGQAGRAAHPQLPGVTAMGRPGRSRRVESRTAPAAAVAWLSRGHRRRHRGLCAAAVRRGAVAPACAPAGGTRSAARATRPTSGPRKDVETSCVSHF